MLRRVHLKKILEENYIKQEGDYIQVNTVWNSGIPKEISKQKRCRFIFSESEDHIIGILFLNNGKNTNARNVFQKLQNKLCSFKIANFKFEIIENPDWRLLRTQSKQIILSGSTRDIDTVSFDEDFPFTKHLPLEFTQLDEIDACTQEEIIDVIGFVKEVPKIQKSRDGQVDYKNVTISSSRSTDPMKSGFSRDIALFGDHMKEVGRKGTVYAFLNIKVKDFANNASLQTTGNTIITKVESLEDLPNRYHNDNVIVNLLPKKRATRRARSDGCIRTDPPYSPSHPGYFTSPQVSENQFPRPVFSPAGSAASNDDSLFLNSLISRSGLNSDDQHNLPSTSNSVKRLRFSESRSSLEEFPEKIYNFVGNYVPLEVSANIKLAKHFMDCSFNEYPMRSKPRGIALILNNDHFPKKPEDDHERMRVGSHQDVKSLSEFLKICNFEVTIKENVSVKDLPSVLNSFKMKFTPEMDACFVAILSHGLNGLVEMVDGKFVRLSNDIIHQFDKTAFPQCAGKPKIFVVQSCQDIPTSGDLDLSQVLPVMPSRENELELKDMIECYAAVPGTSSGRDLYMGSHFIYVLVDTLMEYSHNTDFETILKLVQRSLPKVRRTNDRKLHCTWLCHQFNKMLYFHPGL